MQTDERPRRRRTYLFEIIASIPTVWYLLNTFLDPQPWWMYFLNSAVPYLFALPVIALLWGLIRRRFTTIVAAIIPIILFLGLYGARFQPRTPADAPVNTITVLTHNLNAFNTDQRALYDLVQLEQVDILVTQELGLSLQHSAPIELRQLLPHHEIERTQNLFGMGIFSRFPVSAYDAPELAPYGEFTQAALVSTPQGDVFVVNIHNTSASLSGPTLAENIRLEERERQEVAMAVMALIQRLNLPAIVAGDFNSTEHGTTYKQYTEKLVDTWQARGYGFGHTFPGGPVRPEFLGMQSPEWYVRIDYIFVSPTIDVVEAHIGHWNERSDHRPVVASLTLPN